MTFCNLQMVKSNLCLTKIWLQQYDHSCLRLGEKTCSLLSTSVEADTQALPTLPVSILHIILLAHCCISNSNQHYFLILNHMRVIQTTFKDIFINHVSNRNISDVGKDVRVWPSEGWAGVSTGTHLHGSGIPAGASSGGRRVLTPPTSWQSHPFRASSSDRSDPPLFVRCSSSRSHRRTAEQGQWPECSKTHRCSC